MLVARLEEENQDVIHVLEDTDAIPFKSYGWEEGRSLRNQFVHRFGEDLGTKNINILVNVEGFFI